MKKIHNVIPYEQAYVPSEIVSHSVLRFAIEKNKSFAEQLMEIVEKRLWCCQTEDEISYIL